MASWKKILTVEDIGTTTSLGSSNAVVPSQLAVKTYVDAQVDTADTINELADTTISSVGTGELLRYNAISQKWENKTLSEAGIQSTLGAGSVSTTLLANDSVTTAKMANMATDSFIGRDSAGTGNPEILSASTVRTILNIEDGATADQTVDASMSSSSSNPVENHVVYDQLALKANKAGSTSQLFSTANLIVAGNLTVAGDTTTVNTEEINLADNAIVFNSNHDASTAPSQDAGITVNRGSSTDQSFYWDESADKWAIGHTETASNVFTTTGDVAMIRTGSYVSSQTHVNGFGAIGSFQLNGTSLYVRTS